MTLATRFRASTSACAFALAMALSGAACIRGGEFRKQDPEGDDGSPHGPSEPLREIRRGRRGRHTLPSEDPIHRLRGGRTDPARQVPREPNGRLCGRGNRVGRIGCHRA